MMPGIVLGGIALRVASRTRRELGLANEPRVLFEIQTEPRVDGLTEGWLLLRTRNDMAFRVTNVRVLLPKGVVLAGSQDELVQPSPDLSSPSLEKNVDWLVSLGSIEQHRDFLPKAVKLFFNSTHSERLDAVIQIRLTYQEISARRRIRHMDLLSNPTSLAGARG